MKKIFLAVTLLCLPALSIAIPTTKSDSSRYNYSNVGLKLNLGLGSRKAASPEELERGDVATLSAGYGVSQFVSLWLGVNVSKHAHELNPEDESKVVGVELTVQYKFRPKEKLRPYGTIGLGTVFLGTEGEKVLNGGGIVWALGAEYRLVRFLSVGAEFFWKDLRYTKQGEDGVKGDFTKLERPIDGDIRGFLINFTLQ